MFHTPKPLGALLALLPTALISTLAVPRTPPALSSLPLPPKPSRSPPALYLTDPSPFPIHFPASTMPNFAHPILSNLGCFTQSHLCPVRVFSFYTRFALIQTSLQHVQLLTAKISSYSTDLSNQQSGCPPGCLQERYLREKAREGRPGTGSRFFSFK